TVEAWPQGRTAALIGDQVLDFALAAAAIPIAGYIPTAMPALLAGGAEGLDLVRRVVDKASDAKASPREHLNASGEPKPLRQRKLMAPVQRPGIVLSHGRAYKSHLKEMNREKPAENPSAFMKNVNSIIGPGAPIRLPPQCPDMVDQESEFSI